ncbi:hypothetical protein [Comamonas sp. A7-5]|uniref:hypothetical protein n=1 Tax=Comamonas sp. A7-5 TaxID=673549 RepID=UPI0031D76715
MEFKQQPNVTAKQVIDATRAYKELIRTRRYLQKLGGRMFWKLSGDYVYLAQRSFFDSRKVHHLGIKSSQTEQSLKEYETERARLQQREVALQERISVYERMNKAVRAGAVSDDVIDTIRLLERVGISEDCLWMGTPAQHAYWQSSGLEAPKVLGDGEDLGRHIVFVQRRLDAMSLNKLHRCKAFKLDAVRGGQSTLLIIEPQATPRSSKDQESSEAHRFRRYSMFIHDTVCEYIDLIFGESDTLASFEQVLISKTGRMGVMRTVAPHLFVAWNMLFGLATREKDSFEQLLASDRLVRKGN